MKADQSSFGGFDLRLRPRNSVGRNLPAAIGVGVLFGAVALVAIFVLPQLWYPFVAVLSAMATWEVMTRLREAGYILPRTLLVLTGQAMLWSTIPFGTDGLVAVYVAAVLLLMIGRLFHNGRYSPPRNWLRDASAGVFVLTWIPMFGSFAALISRIEAEGVAASAHLVTFILCVIASDTGGYIAGVMFGKRPMAPAVSPKKSWEGFAGSLVLGITVGILCAHFLLQSYWWMGIVLGTGLVFCATLGDLVESQFKRELGIKDMSQLLPGHGGIMDRLDGLLPAAMLTWVMLNLMKSLAI